MTCCACLRPCCACACCAVQNTQGMTWGTLGDSGNGMVAVLIIFAVEWAVFLVLAW